MLKEKRRYLLGGVIAIVSVLFARKTLMGWEELAGYAAMQQRKNVDFLGVKVLNSLIEFPA